MTSSKENLRTIELEEGELPEPSRCPMCDEANYPMGTLGNRVHYQCRACGAPWSFVVSTPEK